MVNLSPATPESLGLDEAALDRLCAMVADEVASGARGAAEIAVARHGRLALWERFGAVPPVAAPLWLLYSNTKPIMAACLWQLVEDGPIRFTDSVARHVPEFGCHGKDAVTIADVLTHRGGFPSAAIPEAVWANHALLPDAVGDIALETPPGSQLHYHPGSAFWVVAAIIERVTGQDYREAVRGRLLAPLELAEDIRIGVPPADDPRIVDMHDADAEGRRTTVRPYERREAFWRAGVPGGGGYATARGLAAFHQMLVAGGALGGRRLLDDATVGYATKDRTGDAIDAMMGEPMHRGLGVYTRGRTTGGRGFGDTAPPETFGHGGVGSSFAWSNPSSGVSFVFLSDTRLPEPLHLERVNRLSDLVHGASARPTGSDKST